MTGTKRVRLGVIGCGQIARTRLLPTIQGLPAEIVAVCDIQPQNAAEFADRFGAEQVYEDNHEMLSRADLDGVIIAIGPDAHWKIGSEAMEHGLHVFLEKPPGSSASQTKDLLEISRETGRICMTGFKKRFTPVFVKARQIIESDSFGPPCLIGIDRHDMYTHKSRMEEGKCFLLDVAIHDIDVACFLFGEAAEVLSFDRDESCYAASVKFSNGAMGTLSLSCHRSARVPSETVEITGGPGRFITIRNSSELEYYEDDKIVTWRRPNLVTSRTDSLTETGFRGELTEFVTSIQQDRRPEWDIESAYQTMRLFEAIRDSKGTLVTV